MLPTRRAAGPVIGVALEEGRGCGAGGAAAAAVGFETGSAGTGWGSATGMAALWVCPSVPWPEGSPFSGRTPTTPLSNSRRHSGPTEEGSRKYSSYMTWAKPALAVSKTLGSADILPFLTASLRTTGAAPVPD